MEGREGVSPFPEDLTEEEFLPGIIEGHFCAKFYICKTTVFKLSESDLLAFLLELKNRVSVERLCCHTDLSYWKRFRQFFMRIYEGAHCNTPQKEGLQ